MAKIQPTTRQDILCAETPGSPCGMVVFGASGDLARRKLLGSLYNLFKRGLLSDKFYFVGCGRKDISDDEFRDISRLAIGGSVSEKAKVSEFLERIYFVTGDYSNEGFYKKIKRRLVELDKKYSVAGCHIYYLAIPPGLYEMVCDMLGRSGLSNSSLAECQGHPRLVIEKPFGTDLETAVALNHHISSYFKESQIYRIDHYLGKETVQNILMFRFANSIFEPVWNRNYVDHVQITIAESLGIGHRGGYYDKSGALRDMFQNHLLGMLSLVAMEPPSSFEADAIRDEKVKLLKSVAPIDTVIRAQYTKSGKMEGYLQEQDVAKGSMTETFVAAKLFVDNLRWKDVPFYLRTGKRLAKRVTEIAIVFKKVPHSMFASVGLDEMPANMLVFNIQPDEGVDLSFQAKRPGSKICMSTLTMDLKYSEVFPASVPDAYQRLLLDAMVGDQTLFMRQDDVETSWKLMMPILERWQQQGDDIYKYPAGAETFAQAEEMIESDERKWRKLSEM